MRKGVLPSREDVLAGVDERVEVGGHCCSRDPAASDIPEAARRVEGKVRRKAEENSLNVGRDSCTKEEVSLQGIERIYRWGGPGWHQLESYQAGATNDNYVETRQG